MRPGPLLLTAAAGLAVVHVTGVLFASPVFRPAELLAVLCLLAYAMRADLLAGRAPAPPGTGGPAGADPVPRSRPAQWGLTVAAAVLVAEAALTVPAAPSGDVALQVFTIEEYDGLIWRTRLESLAPVAVALLFTLVLLVTRRPAVRSRKGSGRVLLGAGIAAAVLVAGCAVLRFAVLEFGTSEVAMSSLSGSPAPDLAAMATALLPLLLALTAMALAVLTAARRQWRAASGAVLLVAMALIWVDSAIGAVPMPYEVRDYVFLYSSDLIPPTAALPQPTPALVEALRLTAAMLLVTGLTRPRAG